MMPAKQHSRRAAVAVVAFSCLLATVLCDPLPAQAKLGTADLCTGKIIRATILETGGTIKIPSHPLKLTALRVPNAVTRLSYASALYSVEQIGDFLVELKPLRTVSAHEQTNIQVFMGDSILAVELEFAKSTRDVPSFIEVNTRTQEQEDEHQATMRTLRQLVSHENMMHENARSSRREEVLKTGHSLRATIREAPYMDTERYFVFDVFNHTSRAFELDGVRLVLGNRDTIPIDIVHLDRPGVSGRGVISIIPPRRRARGAVRLPDTASHIEIQDMSLALSELRGGLPLLATITSPNPAGGKFEISPITDDDLLQRQRDREARGRVTIQLQPMVGVMWLANPLDDKELDPAAVKGFGLRTSYGFNRFLAIEGTIVAASSDSARFADSTFDGMNGDISRSVTLGHAQIGGLVRLGYRYVPTVRLGIGFQGVNNETRFVTVDGGEMNGPDLGFEFATLLNFGAGFDVRLGRHFIAGVNASVWEPLSDSTGRSVGFGLHIGYGWTPGGVIASQ